MEGEKERRGRGIKREGEGEREKGVEKEDFKKHTRMSQ